MFFGIPLHTIEKEKGFISSQKNKNEREKDIQKKEGKKKKTKHGRYFYKKILMKYQVDYVFD
jgi:hypothetical protein